jgi:hypothetical protein
MDGLFQSTEVVTQRAALVDKTTGAGITGLEDAVAKVWNPDGTLLLDDLECVELDGSEGLYEFSLEDDERSQAGVYAWEVSSPTANIAKPTVGSFQSGGWIDLIKSPVGLKEVHILVQDSISGDPIPEVRAVIFDATGVVLVGSGLTGADGKVTLGGNEAEGWSMAIGTYLVRLVKAGVNFEVSYAASVTADGSNSFTFEGTALTTTLPEDPDVCRISGNMKDLGVRLRDIDNADLAFYISPAPQKSGETIIFESAIRLSKATGTEGTDGVYFDSTTGNFWIDIARGLVVKVESKIAGLEGTFTVPDASTAKLVDLLPDVFNPA